jgi:hypothetical protein
MSEQTSIPVPTALKELIASNNMLLNQYQQELTRKVITANMEMMQLLQLDPADGWRLDTENMVYIKQEPNDTSVST